jgi:nucleoside-diphosphate-sugar epimerase
VTMRVHVTGARGFLGREVLRRLPSNVQTEVSDVDTLNIVDRDAVLPALKKSLPDVVIHLAALKGNQPSKDNPGRFFEVNTRGTLNLLDACRALGVRRLVFMSSLTVHGRSAEEIDEDSPLRPQHPYGASKAAAEAFVHAYCESYGLTAAILRPNFIVGPIPPPAPYADNVIYDFIRALLDAGEVRLAGDGLFRREWVHVGDVADAVWRAALSNRPGCDAFMLAANRVTMQDLAERIRLRVRTGRIVASGAPGFSLISSAAKAREILQWSPAMDLDAIIDEIWAEFQARQLNARQS